MVVGRKAMRPKLHCALLPHGPLKPSSQVQGLLVCLPSDTPAAFRKIAPQFYRLLFHRSGVAHVIGIHRYDSATTVALRNAPGRAVGG
jgi:hypothetical protein